MKAKYYRDSNVPYPRISGARFCGRGQLVCFGSTFAIPVPNAENCLLPKAATKTPRALSAISGNAAASGKQGNPSFLSGNPSITSLSAMMKPIPDPPPPPPAPTYLRQVKKNSSSGHAGARHKMVRIASIPAVIGTSRVGQRRIDSTGSDPGQSNILVDETENYLQTKMARKTPRALSAISSKGAITKPFITIYDANPAIHFNLNLAKNYILSGSSLEHVCK